MKIKIIVDGPSSRDTDAAKLAAETIREMLLSFSQGTCMTPGHEGWLETSLSEFQDEGDGALSFIIYIHRYGFEPLAQWCNTHQVRFSVEDYFRSQTEEKALEDYEDNFFRTMDAGKETDYHPGHEPQQTYDH